MAAAADVGAEIRFRPAAHGGGDPSAHHVQPPVLPGGRGDELLQQKGLGPHGTGQTAQLAEVASQIHLPPQGAKAFLDHQGKAQRLRPMAEKRVSLRVHMHIGHGRHQGAGHGNAPAGQLQMSGRLIVAYRHRRRRIVQPHARRLQRPRQPHVLVPEQGVIPRPQRRRAQGPLPPLAGEIRRHRRVGQRAPQYSPGGGCGCQGAHHLRGTVKVPETIIEYISCHEQSLLAPGSALREAVLHRYHGKQLGVDHRHPPLQLRL